jgi:hypothetical protein
VVGFPFLIHGSFFLFKETEQTCFKIKLCFWPASYLSLCYDNLDNAVSQLYPHLTCVKISLLRCNRSEKSNFTAFSCGVVERRCTLFHHSRPATSVSHHADVRVKLTDFGCTPRLVYRLRLGVVVKKPKTGWVDPRGEDYCVRANLSVLNNRFQPVLS